MNELEKKMIRGQVQATLRDAQTKRENATAIAAHTRAASPKWKKEISRLYILMVTLPIKILHDDYKYSDELCEQVVDQIINEYELVDQDYSSFEDESTIVREEFGINCTQLARDEGVMSTDTDSAFCFMTEMILIVMSDKHRFDSAMCVTFAKKLFHSYHLYKRGLLTTYELCKLTTKITGLKFVKES